MKKVVFIISLMVLFACQKQVDYQPQINILTSNISALQKSRDSLAAALAQTNNNVTALSKSLDSIKVQLTSIGTQIATLNSQMALANANIATLTAQIAALNLQYIDLLAKYNAIILQLTPSTLNTGLVAYYPFNGNANDSIVNGNNGAVSGASLTTDRFGKTNSAYNFNGLNSSILLPKAFFDGNESITQFSFSTFININKTGNYGIWGKTLFWGEVNMQVIDDNSILLFWANSNGGNTYSQIKSASNTIAPNKWYHITINFSNSILKLYINGIEVKSTLSYSKQGGGFISNSNVNSQINFSQDLNSNRIGATTISGSLTNYFNGSIDDFRVYNRVLTTNEIAYLNLN
jgi:hypothetical protein